MQRINQIIAIYSRMKPFPTFKKNNKLKSLWKTQATLFVISLGSLFLLGALVLAINLSFLSKETTKIIALSLFLVNSLSSITFLLIPPINELKSFINLKKEVMNDLVCEIYFAENHIMELERYTESELKYAIEWLNLKINRINNRLNNFFGEKTAIISICGLAYSALQATGGLTKFSETMSKAIFHSGIINTLIAFGLAFLFGLSIGAIALKYIANHFEYLRDITKITLNLKSINNSS